LGPDAFFQHFKTSTRQIGAANAAPEQHITTNYKLMRLAVKRNTAR
jgi:hypothetical protein